MYDGGQWVTLFSNSLQSNTTNQTADDVIGGSLSLLAPVGLQTGVGYAMDVGLHRAAVASTPQVAEPTTMLLLGLGLVGLAGVRRKFQQ